MSNREGSVYKGDRASDSESLPELKTRDTEKVIANTLPAISEEGNVGLSEFEAAKEAGVQVTKSESRRIALKIDMFILPMLCISQGLSYLDKTALNYGNLYGMKTDLHAGQQWAWLASSFYFGYLIGNYPMGWLLQHYHSGRVFAITTFLWGTIVIAVAGAKNFSSALAAYFFLGIVESVVTPGLTLLTAVWYAQPEVPLRTMIWYSFNGWGGIFGGFMSYGVGRIKNASLEKWQYIYLILGAISLSYALVLGVFFPDSPVTAKFLRGDEKLKAVKRVAEAKNGIKNTEFKMYQIKQALTDPKTWLLFAASVAAQIPNGIVSNFSTIIIKGMGFTTLQTTLLDAASSGVQIASLIAAGLITTYIKNTRVFTMATGNIVCIISAACLTYLPSDQKWNRLVAYWFTSFQSVGFSLSLVMISNNIGGFTKRTFTTALTFIGYCVGNIIGPHFLISSEAPTYHTGTRAMFIGYCIKTAAHILLGLYMWRSNVNKDRKYGKVVTEEDKLKGEEAGMHDLTEFENEYHRYVL
ncbi:MFS general substrate transporter [Rhodofomes roseus]|uniref:MFS general substrate transporter n=1 Tax=Rhodofomes roseus TaxID=34475 RepID=A0ABQ8KPL8_9APHY|nr:MFS general substrate transporter [Rhodofomes roseus]KAH9840562.1 MFS general substrate transporter [Rhodofomes roseus]